MINVINRIFSSEASKDNREIPVEVGDLEFVLRILEYRNKRSFLMEEGQRSQFSANALEDISDLYNILYKSGEKAPGRDRWSRLESAERVLASLFTSDLLNKYRVRRARRSIGTTPGILLIAVIASFFTAVFFVTKADDLSIGVSLSAFLIWTLALGALGAAAYVAVNSLGIQNDPGFDLGDKDLIRLRLTVGALFGFVLSLPMTFPSFRDFAYAMYGAYKVVPSGNAFSQDQEKEINFTRVLLILLPFLLGFSTPLVLAIMNRLVETVEALFGVKPRPQISSPVQSSPVRSTPEQARPTDSTPEQTRPSDSTPEQTRPTGSTPEQTRPTSSTPEQTRPTSSTPAQTSPSNNPSG